MVVLLRTNCEPRDTNCEPNSFLCPRRSRVVQWSGVMADYQANHPALPPVPHDMPAVGVAQGTPLVLADVANASRQKKRRLELHELGAANDAQVAAACIREQRLISEHAGAGAAGAPAWAQALGGQIQALGGQIQAQGVQIQAQGVQIQALGVQIAQLSAQLARVANSSAVRDVDALQPVSDAAHQMPNVWFPATRHHLRMCTAAQANALMQFYGIVAAVGPGTIQYRRRLAIAMYIGVREFAPV
jgi:hypothetical protein